MQVIRTRGTPVVNTAGKNSYFYFADAFEAAGRTTATTHPDGATGVADLHNLDASGA